ncbi:MAG: TIGR01906 family membrane protein [Firmicutes bacterium]|nr:TIGR01906 family membrane protein [Bacillota bacterium]
MSADAKKTIKLIPGTKFGLLPVWASRLIALLFAFCAFFAMFFHSIDLSVSSMDYFAKEFSKHGVYESIGISPDDMMNVISHTMDYLRDKEPSLQIRAEIAGEERDFYNERELAHMVDVKELYVGGMKLRAGFALAAAGLFILLLFTGELKRLPGAIWRMALAYIIFAAVLGILFTSDFNRYFTVFHLLFFDNDLWILNPATDLLIRMVPEGFFFDTVRNIVLIFFGTLLASLIVFYALGARMKKRGDIF